MVCSSFNPTLDGTGFKLTFFLYFDLNRVSVGFFYPYLEWKRFSVDVLSLPYVEQGFCWCFIPTLGGTGFLLVSYPSFGWNRVSVGVLSLP